MLLRNTKTISIFNYIISYSVCFGYIFSGRGFAGLHIPGIPIYIGEYLLILSIINYSNDIIHRITKYQKKLLYILIALLCLIAKDIICEYYRIIDTLKDAATVYYILFLFLFSSRNGYKIFLNIYYILRKFHFLFSISFFIHSIFSPFLLNFLIIGDDYYGFFSMPGCLVPPLAMLLIVLLLEKEKNNSLMEYITIGISCVSIILNQSRGGTLGAIVSFLYYNMIKSKLTFNYTLRIFKSICIVSIPIILLIPSIQTIQEKYFNNIIFDDIYKISHKMIYYKFKELVDPEGENYKVGTGHGRITWWKEIFIENAISTKSILFGKGFGYNLGQAIDYKKEGTRGAHNALVNMFGWSGLLGMLLYFSVFSITYNILVLGKNNIKNKISMGYTSCNISLVYLIGVLVSSFFDNSLNSPVTAIPLYIFLGSSISMAKHSILTQTTY